jgi:hypothetical protein
MKGPRPFLVKPKIANAYLNDDDFNEAGELAIRLNISRSELLRRALLEYMKMFKPVKEEF